MSRLVRKPTFCMCENKDADQLRGYNQRLCFQYLDSTMPLLPKYINFKASSHLQYMYSLVCVRRGQNPHCLFSHVATHIFKREVALITNYP